MGRIIAILIVLPILYFGAIFLASEWGGEVIQIETVSQDGRNFSTSVWVVDFDRAAWVRAGDGASDWVARIRNTPQVFVVRNGERKAYHARIFDGLEGQVNEEMRKKYGLADRLVTTVHDPDQVVAIRLAQN